MAGLNDEYLFRPYFGTLPRPPPPTPLFDPVISTPLFFWLEPFR